jgi:hypothetical protein
MNSLSLVEIIQAIAALTAVVRLSLNRLAGRQRALLGFLIFTAAFLMALASAHPHSARYFWTYLAGETLNGVFSIWAVREMFELIFERYPGIRTGGRWAMYLGTAAASAVALLVTAFFRRPHEGSIHLFYFEILDRAVFFTLSVVVVTILVFLSRYPLHLSRNTYVSTGFFSAVFLSEALVLFFDSISNLLFSVQLDVAQILFSAACFIAWAAMLQPETQAAARRVVFESPEEHELLQQLDSLNRLLSRVGRQ